jgi:hypothetical protein
VGVWGLWGVGSVWLVVCGVWRVACGLWPVACGLWPVPVLWCGGEPRCAARVTNRRTTEEQRRRHGRAAGNLHSDSLPGSWCPRAHNHRCATSARENACELCSLGELVVARALPVPA